MSRLAVLRCGCLRGRTKREAVPSQGEGPAVMADAARTEASEKYTPGPRFGQERLRASFPRFLQDRPERLDLATIGHGVFVQLGDDLVGRGIAKPGVVRLAPLPRIALLLEPLGSQPTCGLDVGIEAVGCRIDVHEFLQAVLRSVEQCVQLTPILS